MPEKRKILSVTKDDFTWQFFRGSGAGGQKRNKTSSACRCIHPPSGAVGECQEERQQHQNRQIAFRRCIATREFQTWLRLTCAAVEKGYRDIEAQVEDMMKESNLKFEYYDPPQA